MSVLRCAGIIATSIVTELRMSRLSVFLSSMSMEARKWQRLSDEGLSLEPLPVPKQPMTGWELLDGDSVNSLTTKVLKLSHGTMY